MATSMFYGATRETFRYAHYLRNHLTTSEKILWEHLRKNSLGHRFKSQHPIWRYIVDFYCHPKRLVVEVDGSIHLLEEIHHNDVLREYNLKYLGLNIIRFSNDDIFCNIDYVLQVISNTLYNLPPIEVEYNPESVISPLDGF